MRVVAGYYRGLHLMSPVGKNIRPTGDKVKEAVFSSIQFRLNSCAFLDLFSGTGQMGIEALSRGAEKVVFVDKNTSLVSLNLKQIKEYKDLPVEVYNIDVMSYLSIDSRHKFDIVFMDPPYKRDIIYTVMSKLHNILNDHAIIICEHSKELALRDDVNQFKMYRQRSYGVATITMYEYIGGRNE